MTKEKPRGADGGGGRCDFERSSRTYQKRGVQRRSARRQGGLMYALVPAILVVLAALGGWYFTAGQGSSSEQPGASNNAALFANVNWPTYVSRGTSSVKEAYQFAVARPDVLQYMPCYCGCQGDGHRSNRDCFVGSVNQGGSTIVFDQHGVG